MVNINAQLPAAIATPFHPPTESLQRDNALKPIIPKTEIISSYTKMRDDEARSQFSTHMRTIIQDDSQQTSEHRSQQEPPSSSEQKRARFFARRGALSEAKKGAQEIGSIEDFKVVGSVIQARYKSAVSPLPEPNIDYAV